MSYPDSAALDAANNPNARIWFKDGTMVQLFYGYGGQRRIEEKYGDLEKFLEKLTPEQGLPQMTAIIDAIVTGGWSSGLTYERVEDPAKGLDSRDVEKHVLAVEAALVASFPAQMEETLGASSPTPSQPQGTSTSTPNANVPSTASSTVDEAQVRQIGELPTTQPQSSSVEPMTSFG